MWSINGQWYSSTIWMNGANQANIVKATYGSRSCIGLSGASQASGSVDFPMRIYPSATLSDDTRKMAVINRIRFAAETLSLAAGSSQLIGLIILSDSAESSGSRIDVSLYAYNDGGTYVVRAYVQDYGGSNEWTGNLGTITAGTSFYRLEIVAYLDKIDFYWGASLTPADTVTYAADKTDLRMNRIQFHFEDTHAVWHLDDAFIVHQEVDFSTSLAISLTNGNPDDGEMIVVKKSVIDAAVTAGDAWVIAIADGVIGTDSSDADADYLVVKVLDENSQDGSTAQKMNKSAGGAWTASNWSFA